MVQNPSRMDFAQQVKAQLDIVRVISDYVPRLRRFGNRYSCLCPFHNEKTPSFSIYADHQFYQVLRLRRQRRRLQFRDDHRGHHVLGSAEKTRGAERHPAAETIAAPPMKKPKLRAAFREMHEIAVEHFRANLGGPNGAPVARLSETARRHRSNRRSSSSSAWRTAPAALCCASSNSADFKPEQMVDSGLIGRRETAALYDRFRNRLMFPIHDESGKVIAFGGRALDPEDKAKYLNSPETEIYKKSNVSTT